MLIIYVYLPNTKGPLSLISTNFSTKTSIGKP